MEVVGMPGMPRAQEALGKVRQGGWRGNEATQKACMSHKKLEL